MFKQECNNCKSCWEGIKILKICPFCKCDLEYKRIYDNLNTAIENVFEDFGIEVMLDGERFISILRDYAPACKKDMVLIENIYHVGGLKELYDIRNEKADVIEAKKNKLINTITERYFIDLKWATMSLDWIIKGMEKLNKDFAQNNKVDNVGTEFIKCDLQQNTFNNDQFDKKINVDSIVEFGHYYSNKNTILGKSSEISEEKSLTWKVLKIVKRKGILEAIMISEYGLQPCLFNKVIESTWEDSDVREWLNSTFFETCFSLEEQSLIKNMRVSITKNPRSEVKTKITYDKVTLLSYEEIKKYNLLGKLSCRAIENRSLNVKWWLRTPGYEKKSAIIVNSQGIPMELGTYVTSENVYVRPLLRIEIKI